MNSGVDDAQVCMILHTLCMNSKRTLSNGPLSIQTVKLKDKTKKKNQQKGGQKDGADVNSHYPQKILQFIAQINN